MGETLYGYSFVWEMSPGLADSVSVTGCTTPEEARASVARMAYGSGYRPPKWWEWWRWKETRLPEPLEPPTDKP